MLPMHLFQLNGASRRAVHRISTERRVPADRATCVWRRSPAHVRRNFQLDRGVNQSVRGSDPWVACVARSRELRLKGIDLLQPGRFKTPGGLLRGPADSVRFAQPAGPLWVFIA